MTYRQACKEILRATWEDDADVAQVISALGPAGGRFGRVLDPGVLHLQIAEKLLGPRFERPTFLTLLPSVTSPLVRCTGVGERDLERAWLFVGGLLVADIAGELTDPRELAARLALQRKFHSDLAAWERGCDAFLDDLELGMPPTCGMGFGLDRFLLAFLGARTIRDVIPFPLHRGAGHGRRTSRLGRTGEEPILKPKAALAGSVAAIFAPSATLVAPQRLHRGISCLQKLGWHVRVLPTATSAQPVVCGSARHRCDDLHEAFADPAVSVTFTLYGGFNCNEMLPLIDWDLLRSNPKILCGYSDTTALLVAITEQARLVTFHGPAVLPEFGREDGLDGFTERALLAMLRGFEPPYEIACAESSDDRLERWGEAAVCEGARRAGSGWRWLCPGRARGALLGGHLRTLEALCGTRFWPRWSGRILVVEDCEISFPEFRRSLAHLGQLGVLDSICGIVLGRFARTPPQDVVRLHAWVRDPLRRSRIPVLADVDFGHTRPMLTLPLGALAELDSEDARFRLLESPVLPA